MHVPAYVLKALLNKQAADLDFNGQLEMMNADSEDSILAKLPEGERASTCQTILLKTIGNYIDKDVKLQKEPEDAKTSFRTMVYTIIHHEQHLPKQLVDDMKALE
eukprot:193624-Pyramimonas_sp.AAC.1